MTLGEKLAKLREGAAERIPAENRAIMRGAVEKLRASGIMDGVLKVGDLAPAFALPNVAGDTVRSADLLGQGRLVVTFYRGIW